jgi:hypothetical protein
MLAGAAGTADPPPTLAATEAAGVFRLWIPEPVEPADKRLFEDRPVLPANPDVLCEPITAELRAD